MMQVFVHQELVRCSGCGFSEVIPVTYDGSIITHEKTGAHRLGFKELRIRTSWGHYCPEICERCQHRLDRIDHLKICIRIEAEKPYGDITAFKLRETFTEYTHKEIDAAAWDLIAKGTIEVIAKGTIEVNDKGIISEVKR